MEDGTLDQSEDPKPHATNPWKEQKGKIVGDEKKEQIRPTGKHWLWLLKPVRPTPSNTGLLRSFQRDTERGISPKHK